MGGSKRGGGGGAELTNRPRRSRETRLTGRSRWGRGEARLRTRGRLAAAATESLVSRSAARSSELAFVSPTGGRAWVLRNRGVAVC